MRIYVGGLGSSVQEPDLRKTFTSPQLGTVESVEIIRTKSRSFAYLNFVPASDKGLAKLFSTYNGCLWKGGRIKLEKAKEDYLVRLRREWAEDAQVEKKLTRHDVDEHEIVHAIQKPKNDKDIEKMQLKIFFPKLRKIKPIPLKGTGKHKYSFQRVEVPPLPIHFCDCEEHSGPPEPVKRNYTHNQEMDNYGVNEDELNMMKSILNKLLEKETCSETVPDKATLCEEKNHDGSLVHESQANDDEEDQVSDEDNLVINMVGQSSKKVTSFEDWGQKTASADQDLSVGDPESFSNIISEMHGPKKGKHSLDEKKKRSILENKSNDAEPSLKKRKMGGRQDTRDDKVLNTRPIGKESSCSSNAKKSNKPSWKALVSNNEHTAFNISDILTGHNIEGETEPRSDHFANAPPCSNENGQQDQLSKYKVPENTSDVQSTKTAECEDKSGRGTSWLHKSSWLQLIADANTSEFNLSQILPEATFEKEELQQSQDIDFSYLKNSKQPGFVHKEQESPIGDPPRANKNPSEDVLIKGEGHGAQLNTDSNKIVKESPLTPVLDADVATYNRASGDIVISETCPFMRSAASMKEWVKSKASLSGSHKKKGKDKEMVED